MSNFERPLVSCIMPTFNRRKFVPLALQYYLRQDYDNRELVIVDDGTDPVRDLIPAHSGISYYQLPNKKSLGEKLNLACEWAKGDIIVHWDDDDWYDTSRISYQVEALREFDAAICGINHLLYFNINTKAAFQYIYPPDERTWLLGSSLCYLKSLWKQHPFAPIDVGMDALFVWATPPDQVKPLSNMEMAIHMIHEDNVSPKNTSGYWWHNYPVEEIQRVLQGDWHTYSNGRFTRPSQPGVQLSSQQQQKDKKIPPARNVYACLVHEKEECIIDLVRNLHFHDPASTIVLYNGGENNKLFSTTFPYHKFNCLICPDPVPVRHGYLHPFALKTMDFALSQADFDTFTIVDSDQLAIRKGYCQQLGQYISTHSNTGLLSNRPRRVNAADTDVWTAAQAYKEYALWKPLLNQFPQGEEKFVHWSFWPSTVFTKDAIIDLLKLFKENATLHEIMGKTQIWATEEIILPTLVALLGYSIDQNPCSHDFVNYQKSYTESDLQNAEKRANAYWMHPVHREYNDPLRKAARDKFNHYVLPSEKKHPGGEDLLMTLPLLEEIRKIEGWLSDREADALIGATLKACCSLEKPHYLVEIGSFQGKSTVLLGKVIQGLFPEAKVFAIDPHEGMIGAADQGLQKVAPTLDSFKANIHNAGLEGHVALIRNYSFLVDWQDPISFLFIDGLHDYVNVARDFWKFSPFVLPGGLIAFHDYADYYPGVKALVDEVLASESFRKILLADSLMIVQKA